MTSLLERIVAIIAPHRCLICSNYNNVICKSCVLALAVSNENGCYRCGAITQNSATCLLCRPKCALGNVWVGGEYDGVLAQAIKLLKFQRASAAAKPLAELMALQLPVFDSAVIVTYLPTTPRRVRQRGYDQARLLAMELAKILDLDFYPLLYRQKDCRQLGANKQQRAKQMQQAFAAKNQRFLTDREILLVDDVLTTGASLDSAAQTLIRAGARKIQAVVVAKHS